MMTNKDNNEDTIGDDSEGNNDLIFEHNNQWVDAFLAGRVGDFGEDDNGNNDLKDNDGER